MDIHIDIDDPVPLFTQLVDQIKAAAAEGKLAPGRPLPSIRQLANDLDINHKTVAKAYRLLERDAVIQTKGYRGTFVHPNAAAAAAVDLQAQAERRLRDTVTALRASGVTDSEIRKAFQQAMTAHR